VFQQCTAKKGWGTKFRIKKKNSRTVYMMKRRTRRIRQSRSLVKSIFFTSSIVYENIQKTIVVQRWLPKSSFRHLSHQVDTYKLNRIYVYIYIYISYFIHYMLSKYRRCWRPNVKTCVLDCDQKHFSVEKNELTACWQRRLFLVRFITHFNPKQRPFYNEKNIMQRLVI